ncbi:MAG: 16S rRNA (guanine(527)-N(7))-methyltransferase RsmG [Propionibacteriaceae bacterium]|jgi:16S rRNA (guanine527-N7)-methyltransferase|nr:16S rRNA (guanine(527)-N(7))-methyltransferase RsmG [Propionibacteriaceae bacterium]
MEAALREAFGAAYPALARYHSLLAGRGIEWGLVGPNEGSRLWERHILNSLALEPLIAEGERVLDVGSGAGLPGIPLAIVRPDLQVTLLDSMQRRTDFLRLAVAELGLSNATVARARAEDFPKEPDYPGNFPVVVCRALSSLRNIVRWCLPMVSEKGYLLALKGEGAADEAAELRNRYQMGFAIQLAKVPVPVAQGQANVIVIPSDDSTGPFLAYFDPLCTYYSF